MHDPKREIEKLRQIVSSHDKPLAFLIGAGASCAPRNGEGEPLIPAIVELTERCTEAVDALGAPFTDAYAAMMDGGEGPAHHIEHILSAVRRKMFAIGDNDTLDGLNRGQLTILESTICETIAGVARPPEEGIPTKLPHHALARWIRRTDREFPVEVFTTNYDTLIERSMEDEHVPPFDGFVGSREPFFSAQSLVHDSLAPARRWVRLWKLHGSINWSWKARADGSKRIVRGEESDDGQLILPSAYKYDESRKQPYSAMLDRLHRVLTERLDSVLVTVGYSFGDDHINQVIFDALEVRDRTHVISLQFTDLDDNHVLMKRATTRPNLVVHTPDRACVGGKTGPWRLIEPVDARTAQLLDIPFDSDAVPSPDGQALSGRYRLGDFNWLGRFLDSLAGHDG